VRDWLPVRDFSLRHTLECGQFFRWRRDGDGYRIQTADRFFTARQSGARLYFAGEDALFVRHFFSLDEDLRAIRARIDRDPQIREALDRYWGLRIIRQEPWECVASFLTSIASNIPRITRNIEDLSREYGVAQEREDVTFAFPRPERLDDEAALRLLKLGFRASYLVKAAALVHAGLLDEALCMDTFSAREALMVLPGVAEKVADCILLYAFNRLEAFPVDTWIRKAMIRFYFKGRGTTDAAIREFAAAHFGKYAGYAQQYLYVHARENWKEICGRPVPKNTGTTRIIRIARDAARVRELIDAAR
jgi:N-glycosylase/DNA lyase